MNEDLHIEKAALLADKPGAENLASDRAKQFVADALAAKKDAEASQARSFLSIHPFFTWFGATVAVAACAIAAAVIFRPSDSFGTPGNLQENISVHAGTEVVDTSHTETSDSLAVDTIVLPE